MKTLKNIGKIALLSLALCGGTTSCNYLDVVPPEQASLPDATKDPESTLGFLFSCYGGIRNPFDYQTVEAGADEYVLPPLWNTGSQKITWDLNLPTNIADGWSWGSNYRFIGQCLLFLQQLPHARGVTDEQKRAWAAEANFLLAYYHMVTLVAYGPCPITDTYIDQATPESEYNGRMHFDYVKDWICQKFDEVCEDGQLPATRTGDEWGRATSVMAKALKARLLVYAASPLFNGSFPYKDWENTNFETPGYGKELISLKYDRKKWEVAKAACQEAITAAEAAGHKLFSLEDAQSLYQQAGLPLPFVPFKSAEGGTADKDKEFMERVQLMRYVVTTRYKEGNRETIWGLANQGTMIIGSLPHRVIKNNQGTWKAGYSGVSPTLNTVEHFYTENGVPIEKDKQFYPQSEWYQSAGVTDRSDIIKLNTRREPRFYAWIAFDGGDMGSRIYGGQPLKLEMRNSELHGYNPSSFNRDNCVTGYLSQKFIEPTFAWTASAEEKQDKPRPLIRMAELYLNLAECCAALDEVPQALAQLNIVRKRAGIRELTTSDVTDDMPIMKWVQNERFVELWGEGHRYYDIRRWMIAPEYMSAGVRRGLNAMSKLDPSFEEFNTPVVISQDFKWTNRMYFLPVFENEVYKNPQLVQAPGY